MNDHVEWRFEGGEIRGVKRVAAVPKRLTREQCLEALQRSRLQFAGSFDQLKEETRAVQGARRGAGQSNAPA